MEPSNEKRIPSGFYNDFGGNGHIDLCLDVCTKKQKKTGKKL